MTETIETEEQVTETAEATGTTLCPHCRKRFDASIDAGQPLRLQGAKCPNCKLFVPARLIEPAALVPEPRPAKRAARPKVKA